MRVETRMFKEVTHLFLIAENRNEATILDLILGDCAKGDIQVSGVLTCDADILNPYIRIESAIARVQTQPQDDEMPVKFECSQDEQQTNTQVIRNLAMLVRRLAHRHPNEKLRKQAQDYLLGEGLQGSILREAPQPAASSEQTALITGKQIKHMVERFLGWRLPEDFNPDAGISFKREFNEHTAHPMNHEPTDTNLFNYAQAEAMVRYMIEGMFIPSMDDKDGWVYDPDKRLAEIRAKMSEQELVEKLVNVWFPYADDEFRKEHVHHFCMDMMPIIRAYVSQVAAAERERCIAKCQEILESRKNGHAAGIEAAHLCAMAIRRTGGRSTERRCIAENVPERRR